MTWEINYKLKPFIKELDITGFEDINDVRFNIDPFDDGFNLSGFTIYIDGELDEDCAKLIAQVKANQILDYLTGIHGLPIGWDLGNFKNPDGKIIVESSLKIKYYSYSSKNIDLTIIEDVLNGSNIQLMRQLSHYRSGLNASDDIITQFCEFYMIYEDEYKNFKTEYKYVRDLISHPELGNQEAIDYFEDQGFEIIVINRNINTISG